MNKETCLQALKTILRSNGKAKSIDINNNVIYIDTDIYTDEMLTIFLDMSLSDFNQTPYFSFFTFNDEKFVNVFMNILVEGATLYALSSQALIERGREYTITDNGVNFEPPSLAEFMMTQYRTLLSVHYEKLKNIKNEIHNFNI
jgi:hypothetical protein